MLNEIVKRTIANKIAKEFPRYDVDGDIERIKVELEELRTAPYEERGSELADVIIYCCGIAGYSGIDLEKAVLDKMTRIEARKITKHTDGTFTKEEGQ